MWEAVEFWEGNFANEFNSSTKYRGPPTLERERAWNDLWHCEQTSRVSLDQEAKKQPTMHPVPLTLPQTISSASTPQAWRH